MNGQNNPTPITGLETSGGTDSQDTREVQVYNGQLYISTDSKGGTKSPRPFLRWHAWQRYAHYDSWCSGWPHWVRQRSRRWHWQIHDVERNR